MEKINFYQPKNQFPQAEIRFLLKRLLPPNFKIFNRALNKTILFLLDRKFVFTSRNEEFVKKLSPQEKQFWLPGISDKWKKTLFHQPEKQFPQGAMKFFCKIGFRIISIMVTTSKDNTIALMNIISPRQKRVLHLLFPLVEAIIEIRKNPIF